MKLYISDTHPHLLEEWDICKNKHINIKKISRGSNIKVSWICKNNNEHKWDAVVNNRTNKKSMCPYCSGRNVTEKRTLYYLYKDLIDSEWDWSKNKNIGLDPRILAVCSHKKAFWICKKDDTHKWESMISHRTEKKPRGCPYCSGQKTSMQKNLVDSEWNWEENNKSNLNPLIIGARVHIKASWICSKNINHIWKSTINSRTSKNPNRCPYCSGRSIVKEKTLEYLYKDMVDKEWDWERNNKISLFPSLIGAHSGFKAFFICINNPTHKWVASIDKRTRHDNPTACPICCQSVGERKIFNFLNELKIKHDRELTFSQCKYIRTLPFDFYLTDLNTCIEFDGIQHFDRNTYYSTKSDFNKRVEKDLIKTKFCYENGISLIRISYLEITQIEDILKDILKRKEKNYIFVSNNVLYKDHLEIFQNYDFSYV